MNGGEQLSRRRQVDQFEETPVTLLGLAANRAAARGRWRAGAPGLSWCLDVLHDGVVLPGQPVGVAGPDLVLSGVAAHGAWLGFDGQTLGGQAHLGASDLAGGGDFHAQVVDGPGGAVAGCVEDELERGLGDGEVGVSGA